MSAAKVSHRKRAAPPCDYDLDFEDDDKRSCPTGLLPAIVASPSVTPAVFDVSSSEIVPDTSDIATVGNVGRVGMHVNAMVPEVPARRSPSPSRQVLSIPVSPSNRDRILAACSPTKVNCSLSFAGLSNPNMRFDLQAVVLIVYPACEKPDRRHVALADRFGVAGITVWSTHVPMFSSESVGQVVKITNLTVTTHNGKRNLAMARDSSIKFLSDSESRISGEKMWWNSRLHPSSGSLDVGSFCSFNDDSIVSVSGVLFQIMTDVKRVRNEDKELLTLRIADHSGHVDIRSWNLSRADFHSFIDKPILLQRVRVSSFAGIKVGEMLDGDGTVVSTEFDGAQALANFWKAPSTVASAVLAAAA
jgi:hypothetical protein